MINRILFKHQNRTQLIVAVLGAFIGFTFLVTSIHYLIRINAFGQGEEIMGDNALIIQKKVTNFTTFKIARNDFNEKDIKELQQQTSIEKVQPIINNNFNVSLQTDSKLVPYFRSDIFVQSVDKDFIKVDNDEWEWTKGDPFVPIILPREFLVMLNTFASAKGIPQVSEDLAKSIGFKFKLYNNKNKEEYKVNIVGFTNEVSSILVPLSFMEYGNENFPNTVPAKTTQLILTVKEGLFGDFENYLHQHSMESKESAMAIGKLKSISRMLFSILIGISTITVFLAGLVLIQYAQLIISRNQYEISVLLRQGYSPKKIIRTILYYFIKIFAIVIVISFILFAITKFYIDTLFIQSGINIETQFTFFSILALILAFCIYTIVNYINAKRSVLKIE